MRRASHSAFARPASPPNSPLRRCCWCCHSSISTPSACLTSSRFLPSQSSFWPGSRSTTSPGQNAPSEPPLAISCPHRRRRLLLRHRPRGFWAWATASSWLSWAPCSAGKPFRHRVAGLACGHPGERAGPGPASTSRGRGCCQQFLRRLLRPASIRKAESRLVPFLAASALAYLFLGKGWRGQR